MTNRERAAKIIKRHTIIGCEPVELSRHQQNRLTFLIECDLNGAEKRRRKKCSRIYPAALDLEHGQPAFWRFRSRKYIEFIRIAPRKREKHFAGFAGFSCQRELRDEPSR